MKLKLLTIILMSISLSTPVYANYFTDMATGASATVKEAFVATTGITFWFGEQAKLQRASIKNHEAEEVGNIVAHTGIIAQGLTGGSMLFDIAKLKNKVFGLEELAKRLETANKSQQEALALQQEYTKALQEVGIESQKMFNKIEQRLDLHEEFLVNISKRLEP